jgi:hypothetical protein
MNGIMSVAQILGNLAQIATSIIAVVAAIAAWFFFWKRREYAPRVQFDLGMRLIEERKNEFLIELTATIRNVGLVRHQMRSFTFSVQGLGVGDPWNEAPERNQQISFPGKIVSGRSWIPGTWKQGTFVEPGVIQVYTHNIRINSDYQCLLLYAQMKYDQSKDDHVAIITKSIAELRSAYLDATKGTLKLIPDCQGTQGSVT